MAATIETLTPITITPTEYMDFSNLVDMDTTLEMTDETHHLIRTLFSNDLGPNVRRLNVTPISRQLEIPAGQGAICVKLNILLPSIIGKATIEQCESVVQKQNLCLLKFRFIDGHRFLAAHTSTTLPIKISNIPSMGASLFIGSIERRTEPVAFQLNLCILDTCVCFNCGIGEGKMMRCNRCKRTGTFTRYCSRECQEAHWGVHKGVCDVGGI